MASGDPVLADKMATSARTVSIDLPLAKGLKSDQNLSAKKYLRNTGE
jgi:hypothetical protein